MARRNVAANTNGSVPALDGPLATAQKIAQVIGQAKKVFIERDDCLDALGACLCAGEHLLLLGKPGLAKSAIVHWVAHALGSNYFWIVLNPDTLREDLVGPISMTALNQDRWDRKWSALALADIAMVDEVGKASNQVVNMLLNAFEERKFPTPDGDKLLPLHIAVGASNETLDGDAAAMWDRFTVRTVVHPIERLENFRKMLVSDVETIPATPVSHDELVGLRGAAQTMALHVDAPVIDLVSEMRADYKAKFSANYISDRRWRKLLRVAAGRALLNGRNVVSTEDLIVGQWMLWETVDAGYEEIHQVGTWVKSYAERGLSDLLEIEALAAVLLKESENLTSQQHGADIVFRCRKLQTQRIAKVRSAAHKARWDGIVTKLQLIEDTIMGG